MDVIFSVLCVIKMLLTICDTVISRVDAAFISSLFVSFLLV